MSSVDLIGTRTIDPFTCGLPPEDTETIERAQALLNTIAGYPRVEVDGVFGRETLTAIRNFQASAGLRESGSIDGETLRHLEIEAGRAAIARKDGEEDAHDEHAPVPTPARREAAPTSALADRLLRETDSPPAAADREDVDAVARGLSEYRDLGTLRDRFEALAPRFGVTRGRRTDTRAETVEAQARSVFYLLRRVDRDVEVNALALNIERMSAVGGADPGLALAVASMEGSDAWTARSTRVVDLWTNDWNRTIGNMIHDRDLAHHPGVVPSGPWRTQMLENQDDGSTRRVESLTLRTAAVPERDMPVLTAVQLTEYEADFERVADDVLGPGALDGLTDDARRAWIQLRFAGVGNTRDALEYVRDHGGDPNAIISSPEMGENIHVAIARVRAMRAALFDEMFALNESDRATGAADAN